MRRVLKILGALVALAIILVAGLAAYYFAIRQPVPDLAAASHVVTRLAEGANPDVVKRAQERLAELRRVGGYPSVSVAVAVGGEVVWLEAQGYADLEAKAKAAIETPYAVGSVSKSLTAAVAMRLFDQGRLDLDKDVRAYVPAFPKKAYPVTARQLLSHQAGIRHYRFEFSPPTFSDFGSNTQFETVGDSLKLFSDDPLSFEPDTSFQYSTYGYTLLSAVIEGAAGRPFLEVMQAELFDPLAMTASGSDDKLRPVAGRARDYQNVARDEHVVGVPETNSSNKWAGGGFRSTPQDLARFGIALLDGQVVSAEAREPMFTPRKLKNGKVNPQDYGLGFRIDTISDPAYPGRSWRAVHHGGVAVGSQAMLVLLPEERVVVALSANATTQPPGLGMFDAATDLALMFAETRGK
jgi:serine beta-lactamase-like protein LACTB, mitochondrial